MTLGTMKTGLLAIIVIMLVVPATIAQELEFTPVADASISAVDRDATNNTATLGCQWNANPDSGEVQISFIKFNIEGVAGKTIERAHLELTMSDGTGEDPPAILIRTAPNSWDENSISWNNQPIMDKWVVSGWVPSKTSEGYSNQFHLRLPIAPQVIKDGELTLVLFPQPSVLNQN